MDTSRAFRIHDLFQRLPEGGPQREFALQELTDSYAGDVAMSALLAAAAHANGATGAFNDVLVAATAENGSRRARLCDAVADPAFLALVPSWISELRQIASVQPGTGACTVASALQLWLWTMNHFRAMPDKRATALAELADAFRPLLAARCLVMDFANSKSTDPRFLADLCHVHAARAAASAGAVCAELVFGYRRHLTWDAEGCGTCYGADELDELEGLMPGIASSARAHADVIEQDGTHAVKAGPCARVEGLETFARLRARLDRCLTGARLAKDRAAAVLPDLMTGPSATTPVR